MDINYASYTITLVVSGNSETLPNEEEMRNMVYDEMTGPLFHKNLELIQVVSENTKKGWR